MNVSEVRKAIKSGDGAAVSALLDTSLDPNCHAGDDMTLLGFAILAERWEIVKLLIDRGADVEPRIAGALTPLMRACAHGHVPTIALLIERGAKVNSPCDQRQPHILGRTPLMFACHNSVDVLGSVQLLLREGADIHARDARERTALMLLVEGGLLRAGRRALAIGSGISAWDLAERPELAPPDAADLASADLLLARGADIDAADKIGHTALRRAKDQPVRTFEDFLIARGARWTEEDERIRNDGPFDYGDRDLANYSDADE